ncbi:insulin-degrading enzyme-like isoform X2 [Varroa destructor]|uniref:Insulin-degrading enzyme n=1 Tax=Varroa destructor TaxID=109461 RepID=A0A7M7JG84_VARDE|nr:insulin-degrading enzyme-like isoform X2 [Varroa destructor]
MDENNTNNNKRTGTSGRSTVAGQLPECEAASRLAHKAMTATGGRTLRPFHWLALAAACALLPIIVYAALTVLQSNDVVLTIPITRKSIADRSDYMGLHLRNGMRVLLASKPDSPTGVAMVCVLVGSMSDPEEIQGLAHFTEHMLFMGSKKYPMEGALKTFVYAHGGSYNGFTKDDTTCYYFTVEADYLEGAMDILSNMFKSPLIHQSSSNREVHAVDTEYRRELKSDHWRNLQLDKVTSDQSHDYHKFSVGNQQTLHKGATRMNSTLAHEARKFFDKYYSAGIMHIGIQGKESLSQLKKMAVSKFIDIPDKGVPPAAWHQHPFKHSNRMIIKRVSDTPEAHSLSLSFALHDVSKQLYPLKSLLEHKDKGGLHRLLIKEGWMRSSGSWTKCIRGFCVFYTWFDLTDKGFNHWEDVVSHFFSYIDFISSNPLPDYYLPELEQILRIDYRFTSSFSLITQVQLIEKYNLSDIASAPYLLIDYEPEWMGVILKKLTPDNLRILLTSSRFNGTTDRVEPLYNTAFSISAIPSENISYWKRAKDGHADFHYPEQNRWIPSNFSIHNQDVNWHSTPTLLVDEDHFRLWYYQDTTFNSPRSKAEVYLRTNAIREDKIRTGVALIEDCFKRSIEEAAYGPAVGGLAAYFQSDIGGFRVTVQGYNERLPELAHLVLNNFMSFNLTEECFALSKKSWLKNLKVSERTSSSVHSFIRGRLIYQGLSRRWRERETAMIHCTLEDAKNLLKKIQQNLAAEVYVYGNIVSADAYRVLNSTKELVIGVTVFVESAYNTSLIETRIRDFMTTHVSTFLKNMTEETFRQHLTALITKKRTKPKSVYESGDRYTNEIFEGSLLFNRTEMEAIAASVLTKTDLITMHRRYIASPNRAKMLITLVGSGPEHESDGTVEAVHSSSGERITYASIDEYKKRLSLIEF